MPKGPRLNDISKSFTTRDSLGVEGIATTMQGEICPVVNTVTPRAFYWPFMIWIYYDFYKYSGIEEHTVSSFDEYLKRQDYFFVMATLLTPGADQNNLVGKTQAQEDINRNPRGPYPYNPKYFKTRYGGMQYYNAGCLSMYFITDIDPVNDKDLSFPTLRREGEKMAKAFEAVIKNTEYYRSYRRNNQSVPRSVLEEFGKVINLGLKGFDECKALLKHYMFEDDRAFQLKERSGKLSDCAGYLKYIVQKNRTSVSLPVCRRIFFDHQLPSGSSLSIPEELIPVANKWELVVGRMYFTTGLSMIWKFMLEQLNSPLSLKQWFAVVLKSSDFSWNLDKPLGAYLNECEYGFAKRESMIEATASRNTSPFSVENGLKVIISISNRFKKREDLGDEKAFLSYDSYGQSISMAQLTEQIEKYRERPLKDFLLFVMQYWLVEQHYLTAFGKMLEGRDGFYFEIIDGRYIRKHEFGMDFQGLRMIQLAQVMKDLDML